jgi:hypothetical protein
MASGNTANNSRVHNHPSALGKEENNLTTSSTYEECPGPDPTSESHTDDCRRNPLKFLELTCLRNCLRNLRQETYPRQMKTKQRQQRP